MGFTRFSFCRSDGASREPTRGSGRALKPRFRRQIPASSTRTLAQHNISTLDDGLCGSVSCSHAARSKVHGARCRRRMLSTGIGTNWWPLLLVHDLRTFACPRIIVEHACRMLYCARAIRARWGRLLCPCVILPSAARIFYSSLDTHSHDSYSAAERKNARAEATRPTLRVANSLTGPHVRVLHTAERHDTF